jgi:hypothetical protein
MSDQSIFSVSLQFTSAFLLLGIGIILSGLLLLCEHCYFLYLRRILAKLGQSDWVNLISTDVAESLDNARELNNRSKNGFNTDDTETEIGDETAAAAKNNVTKLETIEKLKYSAKNSALKSSCHNPVCNLSINSVTQELQSATQRIKVLQKQLADVDSIDITPTTTTTTTMSQQKTLKLWQTPAPNVMHVYHRGGNRLTEQNISEIETVL